MEVLIATPFKILEINKIEITKPIWLKPPSPKEMISLISLAYFLIIGGVIYDALYANACFGTTVDKYGQKRVVAVMPKSLNIQDMVDTLLKSLVSSLAGVGFLYLDSKFNPSNANKNTFISIIFLCILFSFFTTWLFNKIMYPTCNCVKCF